MKHYAAALLLLCLSTTVLGQDVAKRSRNRAETEEQPTGRPSDDQIISAWMERFDKDHDGRLDISEVEVCTSASRSLALAQDTRAPLSRPRA